MKILIKNPAPKVQSYCLARAFFITQSNIISTEITNVLPTLKFVDRIQNKTEQ